MFCKTTNRKQFFYSLWTLKLFFFFSQSVWKKVVDLCTIDWFFNKIKTYKIICDKTGKDPFLFNYFRVFHIDNHGWKIVYYTNFKFNSLARDLIRKIPWLVCTYILYWAFLVLSTKCLRMKLWQKKMVMVNWKLCLVFRYIILWIYLPHYKVRWRIRWHHENNIGLLFIKYKYISFCWFKWKFSSFSISILILT